MNANKILLFGLLALGMTYPPANLALDPFAGLPDPTRNKKPAKPTKKVVKKVVRKPLTLQSTLIAEDSSHAIINGKPVTVGERVEGATVLTINPYDVVLERFGQQITLQLLPKEVIHGSAPSDNED